MEIVTWDKSGGGQMVRVNRKEALELIVSLSQQILTNDCNTERTEFTDSKGRYFSISVQPVNETKAIPQEKSHDDFRNQD